MRRIFILLTLFLCVAANFASAQEYVQTPVTVSTDKVRGNDGKIYYSHVVKERQTLFSIAKAYGVTVDAICDANPTMNLRQEGLKNNSIILIPVVAGTEKVGKTEEETPPAEESDYFIHVVKWYETLNGISRKYGVDAEDIMYLNGLKDKKLKSRMKLKIPRGPIERKDLETEQEKPVDKVTPEEATDKEEDETSIAEQKESIFNWGVFNRKNTVNAVLMLPFDAGGNPSESNLDFYCGVLTALKTLKEDGVSTDISVYDVAGGKIPVTVERIKASDIIIGPIDPASITKVLAINPGNTPIVSPLNHKAISLVATNPALIQTPSSYNSQYKDIADWVYSEKEAGDKVVLISETSPRNALVKNSITAQLYEAGVGHVQFSYNILEGRKAVGGLTNIMTSSGTNRVVIASDSEAFVSDVVRNLTTIAHSGKDIIIYAPSKIRSFDTIETESLHNLNLHTSTSYFIDYTDPAVKKFLMTYRALYNTEPSQFSYQGYDIAYYFISTCAKYGNSWRKHLASRKRVKMLQSDFLFSRQGNGGYENNGIRRVIYNKNFTITLAK